MRRVFILVLDSLGVGAMPDADRFGEEHTHTLDHIVTATGGLEVPRLQAIGLGHIEGVHKVTRVASPTGAFGRMNEVSTGKDTSTGHWEMMGCPLLTDFPVYPDGFPASVLEPFIEKSGIPGILCNAAASGTEIIARLGEEHVTTGKPIVYTSADSVFQVAAHEQHFGLERLYEICQIAREIFDPLGLGRVIARPFIDSAVGVATNYERTYNRKDFSLEPPTELVLDRLKAAGIPVVGVGKISDIYNGRGVSRSIHTEGNRDSMRHMTEVARSDQEGLVFVNLVDFDMLYGHRRDPVGYRRALEEFDGDLCVFEDALRPDDLVFMTADHGNDPTYTVGTDHTREYVPILATGPSVRAGVDLGTRASFADLGATVEEALGLDPQAPGQSFLTEIV
jgi:phosphopentomutase